MKGPALILFGLVQMTVMFDFGPAVLFMLTCLAVAGVALKGVADSRPFDSWAVVLLALALLTAAAVPWMIQEAEASEPNFTMRLEVDGQTLEGKPLRWSDQSVLLLGRDGRIWQFPTNKAKNFVKVSSDFTSLSQSKLRTSLLHEFGKRFDVSGTGHYLVVHPRGQRDKWAMRFEQLYRGFVHYFTARGLKPQRPEFPLVAVVFPTQKEFHAYAARTGAVISSGVLGYYSPTTNRILLFDVSAGREELWHLNADTIIHEAAHQTGFNTGVHDRLQSPPRWVVEGVGMLFEVRGVWDASRFSQREDRVNRGRLVQFKQYAPKRAAGSLPDLITSDRLFRSNPTRAYSEAWALTFFLSETRPRQYARYVAATSKCKENNSVYRLKTFTDHFGTDLQMLEVRFLRFVEGLKVKND